jgi:hypothetical protein
MLRLPAGSFVSIEAYVSLDRASRFPLSTWLPTGVFGVRLSPVLKLPKKLGDSPNVPAITAISMFYDV